MFIAVSCLSSEETIEISKEFEFYHDAVFAMSEMVNADYVRLHGFNKFEDFYSWNTSVSFEYFDDDNHECKAIYTVKEI